jgi:undecaprenyl-diphosphatase
VPLFQIVVLAGVQGLTEFLPISSSAHLILVPHVTGWDDQGLLLDVAVHVGTLGAVILYFWRDVWAMISGVGRLALGRRDPGARLAAHVIVATIPVIVAGVLYDRYYPGGLRGIEVIAWATLIGGVVLWAADNIAMTVRRIEHLGVADALVIGLVQCLALIPGASRAGVTMTAARVLGMERTDAARFSMLLSIPAILGAGVLKGVELAETGSPALTSSVLTAAGLAFVFALLAIAVMMAWLKRAGFGPFVLYRIALGGVLLAVAYGYLSFDMLRL